MKRCAGCGAKLDPRNHTGLCRECFNAQPMARRLPWERLAELVAEAPQALLAQVLERKGFQVIPPGGSEV